MSAPYPSGLLLILTVLPFLGPAVWGVLCSLVRKRLLGPILLIVPYVITVILWPSMLRFDFLLDYLVLIYAVPALFGYGIGIFLMRRYRQLHTTEDLTMGIGLTIMLLGFEIILTDYLSHWVLGLSSLATTVLAIGLIIGISGVILARVVSHK